MITGRALVDGEARGVTLVLEDPLSFWGGLDPATGHLIDPHHPRRGELVTGRILVMPSGRGSSSSSSVLAESIRLRTAPAAIVLAEPDELVALGAIVARELYGIILPVLTVGSADFANIEEGATVRVRGPTIAPLRSDPPFPPIR